MQKMLYIHPENPQARLIKQVITVLTSGGVIVIPTDSGYALACLLGEKSSMERICKIRQLDQHHNFTLLCRDISEAAHYSQIDNHLFRLIKNNTPGAYTFILSANKEVPRRVMQQKKKTIGIRLSPHSVIKALLAELDAPLLSSSLILPSNDFAESDPEEIQDKIGNQVDIIIASGTIGQHPTSIIDLTTTSPVVLRVGSGDITPFS